MKKKSLWGIFWALMFIGAFLALGRSGYSDGDDAFFYLHTNQMGFLEYLGWRYETWVGRLGGEAMIYVAFRQDLLFWRVVNALMLMLLPMGVLHLASRAARIPKGRLRDCFCRSAAYGAVEVQNRAELGAAVACVSGYFLMAAMTLGYAAVWVNGSVFYTWSFTCGIWALVPFADYVFSERPPAEPGRRIRAELSGVCKWHFLYAILCAVIAATSIEQMGAVLAVFELIGILYGILKWRRVHVFLAVQTLLTWAAYGVLFAAPGNELRVASEITTWMPEFETMPFGQHLFITAHWLLSSFANENKLFLCGIWIVGMLLLLQKKERKRIDLVWMGAAAVFTAVALLPYAGIRLFSEFGMQYVNITACMEQVPRLGQLGPVQLFAMTWWAMALVFTFFFLWRVSGCQITLLLAYLAGIASEAIMFFSPTMYASGARVYYLTDILYLFVILALTFGLRDRKWRNGVYGGMAAAGVLNFIFQLPIFLQML